VIARRTIRPLAMPRVMLTASLAVPVLVLFTIALLIPLIILLRQSLLDGSNSSLTLENYAAVIRSLAYRRALLNSVLIAFASTLLALILCFPVAGLHRAVQQPLSRRARSGADHPA
jgi:ABC-type spermidine/putrescine transport system permease subunit I